MIFVVWQILSAVLVFLTVAIPNSAWACSVCFLAKKENLAAYFGTGVLLSVLPFFLIGGIGFWLYRQVKDRSRSLNSIRVDK
jgi:hypothetical protein